MENYDIEYIGNLMNFLENSEEDKVDSKIFLEKFPDDKKTINWLDVGAGPGTKLIKILEKIKNKCEIKLDILEPSKKWIEILLNNFKKHNLEDCTNKIYNLTWEEFDSSKKYDLITFFHSVYGINTKSLGEIPNYLIKGGLACIVVETPNSDLHKIKKSLFPFVHYAELIFSSENIVDFLDKKGIKYHISKKENPQRFYIDLGNIKTLSFILQTKFEDQNKLLDKEIQKKIKSELGKYTKIDKNNKMYINVPDRFIWISKH